MSKHDPTQSKGPTVLAVSIVFTVIALIATVLRLFTRFYLIKNHGMEDYSITLATMFSVILTILIGEQVRFGMGRHFDTISQQEFVQSLKPFWVSIWIYYLALTFTKLSILVQYYRLFVYRKTRIAIWIFSGIVIAYGVATVFDSIFLCTPVALFWDQSLKGQCLNRSIVWYANAAINILLDVGIVILPMPAVRSLGLPKRQKIGVIILFALGGFVCITSIIRLRSLQAIATSKDITWDNPPAAMWSSLESNVGIVCACLPTLRPFFLRYVPLWWGDARERVTGSRSGGRRAYGANTPGVSGVGMPRSKHDDEGASPLGPLSPHRDNFSSPTHLMAEPRTQFFGESQSSVSLDADMEDLCRDGWTQKSEKGASVTVSRS